MVRATLLSIPISVFIIGVFFGLFRVFWGRPVLTGIGPGSFFLFLFILLTGIVLHEALHALGWKFAAGVPWSAMKFGINWKVLAPYAHCKVPMMARAYRVGILLPGFALGLFPGIAGLLSGSFVITSLGAMFSAAASGDLLGFWAIRSVPSSARVLDHPTELGCEVIEE